MNDENTMALPKGVCFKKGNRAKPFSVKVSPTKQAYFRTQEEAVKALNAYRTGKSNEKEASRAQLAGKRAEGIDRNGHNSDMERSVADALV